MLYQRLYVSVVTASPDELQPFALQQLDFWAFDTRLVAQLASLPAVNIAAKMDHQDELRTSHTSQHKVKLRHATCYMDLQQLCLASP